MGNLFAADGGKVTEHDRAVLELKTQRDRMIQYQKRVRWL